MFFLELRYDSEGDRLLQSGNAQPNFDYSRTVFYDGGQFPFDTNEFDYVICSHVLEHLAIEDVECFINELQRIAPKGYLEFPSLYYELICFPEAHELFMNYKHGNILIFPKKPLPKDMVASNNALYVVSQRRAIQRDIQTIKRFSFS